MNFFFKFSTNVHKFLTVYGVHAFTLLEDGNNQIELISSMHKDNRSYAKENI